MPYIEIKTNVPVDNEKEIILKSRIADNLASSFRGKTEKWLMVNISDNQRMYFGGADDPCALVSVDLLGKQQEAGYEQMTAYTCKLISETLGIKMDRVYIKYMEYEHWGWNGSNF